MTTFIAIASVIALFIYMIYRFVKEKRKINPVFRARERAEKRRKELSKELPPIEWPGEIPTLTEINYPRETK